MNVVAFNRRTLLVCSSIRLGHLKISKEKGVSRPLTGSNSILLIVSDIENLIQGDILLMKLDREIIYRPSAYPACLPSQKFNIEYY